MGRPQSVILASASPRRRELLSGAAFDVVVRPQDADERWPPGDVYVGVVDIARRKLDALGPSDEVCIAADTTVVLDHHRLGKPADVTEAERMLEQLSGREHTVVTGYCVRRGGEWRTGHVSTKVRFRALSSAELKRYASTGESLDKAGAYGIQGLGMALIDRIDGSFTNVVGLPLTEVIRAIEELS